MERSQTNHSFANRVAMVTGGASGIGRAVSLAFAAAGASVLLSDIDEAGGEETVRMIQDASGAASFACVDVTQTDQVDALVQAAVDAYGRLDIAVNNAGLGGPRVRTGEYPQEDWHRLIDVNLHGTWYCMRAELAQMLKQGGGAIVNVSSVAGVVGFPSHAAYAASKHAVVGLTKTAALEYVRKGIRINAVCPGFTETPMVQQEREQYPEYAARLVQGVPARRLGTPEEVAAAILYLCSDQAGFIVGHTLVLDGGITAM